MLGRLRTQLQLVPRGACACAFAVWRPSSLTRYINGRTASREESFPTPKWGPGNNKGVRSNSNLGRFEAIETMAKGQFSKPGPEPNNASPLELAGIFQAVQSDPLFWRSSHPQIRGEIATVPENRSKTYCGNVLAAVLVMGNWVTLDFSCWRHRLGRRCGGVSHHGGERTAAAGRFNPRGNRT
jgi:hypothetical protein